MDSDYYTKPLQGELFYKHRASIMGLPDGGLSWADRVTAKEGSENTADDHPGHCRGDLG